MTESTTDAISIREGIVIGRAGDRDLLGDVYLPSDDAKARPAIVVVHGGGWRKGSRTSVKGFGVLLSQAGFVCLCVDYRLIGEALWPAQIEDIKCAVRFLKANQDELGVDPDRIGVNGDSAGGHLALMAGVTSDFEGAGGHEEFSSDVKAVSSMYGPSTIQGGSAASLIGEYASQENRDAASPLAYDLKNFPPCLLMHGVEDQGVPLTETTDFYQKLMQSNRIAELHLFAGEGHAFDRQSSTKEKMVDIADPSSVCGEIVIELIRWFFSKYL
jgi:acetyl esterase/lipase